MGDSAIRTTCAYCGVGCGIRAEAELHQHLAEVRPLEFAQ